MSQRFAGKAARPAMARLPEKRRLESPACMAPGISSITALSTIHIGAVEEACLMLCGWDEP
jgi:hypothetical protein